MTFWDELTPDQAITIMILATTAVAIYGITGVIKTYFNLKAHYYSYKQINNTKKEDKTKLSFFKKLLKRGEKKDDPPYLGNTKML